MARAESDGGGGLMAELHVPLSNHGPCGLGGRTVLARVSLTDEVGIYLELDADTDDESSTARMLDPSEARALAAALVHFADEVEG